MVVEEEYVLGASEPSAEDCKRKVSDVMKSGMADDLGCERVLKHGKFCGPG